MEKELLEQFRSSLDEIQKQLDLLRSRLDREEAGDTPVTPEVAAAPDEPAEAVDIILDSEFLVPENPRTQEIVPETEVEPEPDVKPESEPEIVPETETDIVSSYAWGRDIPASPTSNIISGISLNDRVLLINTLFGEDPMLFQETIGKLNGMSSLKEGVGFLKNRFPSWDFSSEVVYRLMMAVRRKLR